MSKQIIEYSAAACGSGKTTWAINTMAGNAGRYIYAVDRIEEFEKRTEILNKAARHLGTMPTVRPIHSGDGTAVTRQFPEVVARFSDADHVIIIITHAALKLVDHRESEGWTLLIDEDPKLWVSDSIDAGAPSRPTWEALYNLSAQTVDGYSVVSLRADAPSYSEVARDSLTRTIAPFHNRVRASGLHSDGSLRQGSVIVKLTSWHRLTDRLTWFSIWDVRALAGYDRVIILANAFDQLLTAKLIRRQFPEVELKPVSITRSQPWCPRSVQINYVADDHTSTVNHLANTHEGRDIVAAWSAWVSRMVGQSHYWCANRDFPIPAGVIPGKRISPKIAGSNEFMLLHECSILYAAKASPNEARVFADLAGGAISFEDVRRDREFEDLIQVVFRSSLRDPASTAAVTLNVYDIEQAEFIARYFEDAGFPFQISLTHHDIGARKTVQKRGPKTLRGVPLTAAERAKRHRDRKKGGAK